MTINLYYIYIQLPTVADIKVSYSQAVIASKVANILVTTIITFKLYSMHYHSDYNYGS